MLRYLDLALEKATEIGQNSVLKGKTYFDMHKFKAKSVGGKKWI